MSRRNSRNSRKGFAEGKEDFLYFLYFFDERSGKADDCGTIKIATIKLLSAWGNNFPAEIAERASLVEVIKEMLPERFSRQ